MVAQSRIAIVVGDIGSTQELIPAVGELQNRGVEIKWIADTDGKGKDQLLQRDIQHLIWRNPGRLTAADFASYNAVVIGTSATAIGAQIDCTLLAQRAGIPVLWLEDLCGTGERPDTQVVNPDVMLVIDATSAKIANRVRPVLRTEIVGKPTFAKLAEFTPQVVQAERLRLRRLLGIQERDVVIVFWSSGVEEQVTAQLEVLLSIREIGSHLVIHLPRLHPKLHERAEVWDRICHDSHVRDAQDLEAERVNFVADLVVGQYGSTQTYAAALCGIQPMVILWPDSDAKRRQCGFPQGIPPLIYANIARGAYGREEVISELAKVIAGYYPDVRHKAYEAFGDAVSPDAAGRIADAILKHSHR